MYYMASHDGAFSSRSVTADGVAGSVCECTHLSLGVAARVLREYLRFDGICAGVSVCMWDVYWAECLYVLYGEARRGAGRSIIALLGVWITHLEVRIKEGDEEEEEEDGLWITNAKP